MNDILMGFAGFIYGLGIACCCSSLLFLALAVALRGPELPDDDAPQG